MSTAETLLAEIVAFCARHGMSETTFGREVAGDGHMVRRLRAGHSMTLRRFDQCRDFMRARDESGAAKSRVA